MKKDPRDHIIQQSPFCGDSQREVTWFMWELILWPGMWWHKITPVDHILEGSSILFSLTTSWAVTSTSSQRWEETYSNSESIFYFMRFTPWGGRNNITRGKKYGSPITNDSGSSDILPQCVGNRTGPTGIYKAPIFLDNLRWEWSSKPTGACIINLNNKNKC